MGVIGHNHHLAAFHTMKFIFQFVIPFFNHFPRIIQHHFIIYDYPKQMQSVLGANGYEIQPRL